MKYFSDRFQVVCPFVRGEGPSENGELSRHGLAAQTLDFLQMLCEIEKKQKRPIILMGHDLGAVHAWNLAPYLGNRLAGLVIFNGLHLRQWLQKLQRPRQHIKSWYIYAMQVPWVSPALIRRFPKTIGALAYRLGGLSPILQPGTQPDSIIEPAKQYRAFMRDIPSLVRRPVQTIDAPALVVWGEKDPFIENITADEFARYANDVTFRILPKGHWHFREDPEETNRILEGFFGSLHPNEAAQ